MDGWKVLRLPVESALAALLMVSVAACGDQGDVPDSARTPELVARADIASSATAVVEELARKTPTPYSRSVPSPVVVTATSVPSETVEAAAEVSLVTATPAAIESPTVNGFIAPTVVVGVHADCNHREDTNFAAAPDTSADPDSCGWGDVWRMADASGTRGCGVAQVRREGLLHEDGLKGQDDKSV